MFWYWYLWVDTIMLPDTSAYFSDLIPVVINLNNLYNSYKLKRIA
jgi:hypothetical protein